MQCVGVSVIPTPIWWEQTNQWWPKLLFVCWELFYIAAKWIILPKCCKKMQTRERMILNQMLTTWPHTKICTDHYTTKLDHAYIYCPLVKSYQTYRNPSKTAIIFSATIKRNSQTPLHTPVFYQNLTFYFTLAPHLYPYQKVSLH